MDQITQLQQLKSQNDIAITVGNFDGVHLGHQYLLSTVRNFCQTNNAHFSVMTFNPHPVFIFGQKKDFLIDSYENKREMLEKEGVQTLVEIDFTRDFSNETPEEFLKNISDVPNIKYLFFGHDFRFGAGKKGDYHYAREFFEGTGIEVFVGSEFSLEESLVSSTQIRTYLKSGDIPHVNKMLGREFNISGSVIKGKGRGKKEIVPTVNVRYNDDLILPSGGVYITSTLVDGISYKSLTNIGVNPTYGDLDKISLESHLLNFTQDVYGENISVVFFKKLRDEIKFDSPKHLKEQVMKDLQEREKHL
jgi:riboflavin kinase / FMN adenylyltransferase